MIWTRAYRPFILGGNVHANMATELVLTTKPIKLGKGITVYEIQSPHGTTHIAEASTGALVGTSLQQVKQDLAEADPKVVKQQLEEAQQVDKYHCSNEEFWKALQTGKPA